MESWAVSAPFLLHFLAFTRRELTAKIITIKQWIVYLGKGKVSAGSVDIFSALLTVVSKNTTQNMLNLNDSKAVHVTERVKNKHGLNCAHQWQSDLEKPWETAVPLSASWCNGVNITCVMRVKGLCNFYKINNFNKNTFRVCLQNSLHFLRNRNIQVCPDFPLYVEKLYQ